MFTPTLGHAAAQSQLAQLMATGRMPHAILLAGPQGIGKATLAGNLAARLICGGQGLAPDTTSAQYHQLLAGSCPDYHLVTVPEKKKTIGIDSIRELLTTLKRTADTSRVIVIDAVDDLTTEAANTLLKTLEEPRPGIYFILIAHRLGQILPTIRSRCRLVTLTPLGQADTQKILLANGIEADDLPAMLARAQGCPGQVLADTPAQEQLLQDLAAIKDYPHSVAYQKALRQLQKGKDLNIPVNDSLAYLKSLIPNP